MSMPATSSPMRGRVALIAGASKGIGAATAEAFADAGAAVVLAARDAAALETVAQQIKARGGQATAIPADVSDADSVRDLVASTLDAYGRLDAAFNNATDGPRPAPLADIDPAEFDLGIATNVRGTFLGMKFQIPAMLASGGGERLGGGRPDAPARARDQGNPAFERQISHDRLLLSCLPCPLPKS